MAHSRAAARRPKSAGTVFAAGGAAAALSAAAAIADIAIGIATGGTSGLPRDAAGHLAQLIETPALGLYRLDLLNLAAALAMVPLWYACWRALGHRLSGDSAGPKRAAPSAAPGEAPGEAPGAAAAGLSLVLGILGAAAFTALNPALPMLELSRDYAGADPARRALLAAAGEAILARGGHGGAGAFPAFLLVTTANLVLSVGMLGSKVFGRAAGILGLSGNLLLTLYLVLVTFLPGLLTMAMALAAPGGLLAIAWFLMTARGLLRLARASAEA